MSDFDPVDNNSNNLSYPQPRNNPLPGASTGAPPGTQPGAPTGSANAAAATLASSTLATTTTTSPEEAKKQACELYKLVGDVVQMQRLGCENVPSEKRFYKTIPRGDPSEDGTYVDDTIADAMRYILLGALLIVAVLIVIVCCCRFCTRVSKRRAALRLRREAESKTKTEKGRSCGSTGFQSSYRPSPCCGGFSDFQSNYRPTPAYMPTKRIGLENCGGTGTIQQNFKLNNKDCHDCCTINLI